MESKFESKKLAEMVACLKDLYDNDLLGLYRDVNSYNGSFQFVNGYNMEDFILCEIEGIRGNRLRDFIYEVAEAVNDYNGNDGIEYAQWGYFDGYTLEIKDVDDIAKEAREEDYIDELADYIIDWGMTDRFYSLPSDVEELLNKFSSYESYGWEGAGEYRIKYADGNNSMWFQFDDSDFESYAEWLDELEVDGVNKKIEKKES